MRTGLIRTFVGSQPGPMEELSKYFYWPDLQTPAGVCLLILFCFMMDLWSGKALVHCIPVIDLHMYPLHSERQ